jgi:HPt (histidine-containing phosphotransfer) domain-containing protein
MSVFRMKSGGAGTFSCQVAVNIAPNRIQQDNDMSYVAGIDASLPLIDDKAMADWCADLDKEDIEAILSQVPEQCALCLREIEGAVAAGDLHKSKRIAHRMKGMAANLGATRLSRLARCIEIDAQAVDDVAQQLPGLHATVEETLAALATLH